MPGGPPQEIQPWIVQLFDIAGNVVLGIAAFITVKTGTAALRTWRAELKGKTQYEVARKLYIACSEYVHAFRRMQRIALSPDEWSGRPTQPGEDQFLVRIRNEQYARFMRATGLLEKLQSLREISWEAHLVLDIDSQKLFGPFDEAWNEYHRAVDFYYENQETAAQGDFASVNKEEQRKYSAIVRGIRDDPVSKGLTQALDDLRGMLRPFIHD